MVQFLLQCIRIVFLIAVSEKNAMSFFFITKISRNCIDLEHDMKSYPYKNMDVITFQCPNFSDTPLNLGNMWLHPMQNNACDYLSMPY